MPFLILFLSLIKTITSQQESKTLFVFEHCRHGARGMKDLFNEKDILNEKWIGKEELSSVGLRQHYLLGVLIRKKYKNLLNWDNLNNLKDIFVYSTPSNRTIMSARAQLFGMFNYNNNSKLSEKQIIKATPNYLKNNSIFEELIKNLSDSVLPNKIPSEIPIHIIEREEKLFQFEKDEQCEGIKKQRKKNEMKTQVKNSIKEFNELFITDELKKYLNCKNDSEKDFTKLKNIQTLALSYIINKVDGRNLIEFEKLLKNKNSKLFYDKCMEILQQKSLEIQSGDNENLIAYASSSVLLRFILNLIDKVVENDKLKIKKNNVPKFFLLSAHDTTLVMASDLLKILFNSEKKFPSFATSQIFELNKINNEYYINLIFNNETLKKINYEEFKSTIKKKCWTLEQTGYFCGFMKKTFNGWKTLTFIFGFSCIIVILLFLLKCYLKKRENIIEL